MAKHLRNERCPECAKLGRDRHGDNLGVYDDGSYYCWRCGYHKYGNTLPTIGRDQQSSTVTPAVVLPSDVDTYIPAVARSWLGKYNFTENDILNNRLMWSEYWQQLIFPYFDKYNNLVAWQGRSFGEPRKQSDGRPRPKWFSQGDLKKLYHILPIKEIYEGEVVLVEDIVSAIVVSKVCPAMPIFGSKIGLERFKTLSGRFSGVVLWLDPDMKTQMVVEAKKASLFGLDSRVVFSDRDPKEHTEGEIKWQLGYFL